MCKLILHKLRSDAVVFGAVVWRLRHSGWLIRENKISSLPGSCGSFETCQGTVEKPSTSSSGIGYATKLQSRPGILLYVAVFPDLRPVSPGDDLHWAFAPYTLCVLLCPSFSAKLCDLCYPSRLRTQYNLGSTHQKGLRLLSATMLSFSSLHDYTHVLCIMSRPLPFRSNSGDISRFRR